MKKHVFFNSLTSLFLLLSLIYTHNTHAMFGGEWNSFSDSGSNSFFDGSSTEATPKPSPEPSPRDSFDEDSFDEDSLDEFNSFTTSIGLGRISEFDLLAHQDNKHSIEILLSKITSFNNLLATKALTSDDFSELEMLIKKTNTKCFTNSEVIRKLKALHIELLAIIFDKYQLSSRAGIVLFDTNSRPFLRLISLIEKCLSLDAAYTDTIIEIEKDHIVIGEFGFNTQGKRALKGGHFPLCCVEDGQHNANRFTTINTNNCGHEIGFWTRQHQQAEKTLHKFSGLFAKDDTKEFWDNVLHSATVTEDNIIEFLRAFPLLNTNAHAPSGLCFAYTQPDSNLSTHFILGKQTLQHGDVIKTCFPLFVLDGFNISCCYNSNLNKICTTYELPMITITYNHAPCPYYESFSYIDGMNHDADIDQAVMPLSSSREITTSDLEEITRKIEKGYYFIVYNLDTDSIVIDYCLIELEVGVYIKVKLEL